MLPVRPARPLAAVVVLASLVLAAPAVLHAGPARPLVSARYTLTVEYSGTLQVDMRWPDGQMLWKMGFATDWEASSPPFTVWNRGTAARAQLWSRAVRLAGPIDHRATGLKDMGDWVDVTGTPKRGECRTGVRQFLDGPATGQATVQLLPPAGPGAAHTALIRLSAPGAVVRTHYDSYQCTVPTFAGEPTEVVTVPDLVTACGKGDLSCLVLPPTTIPSRYAIVVTSSRAARVGFRRPVGLAAIRNGLTDPALRQELPGGGSLTYVYRFRLRLVPAR